MRTWNIASGPHPLETIEHHTEFVVGLDFNLHVPGQVRNLIVPFKGKVLFQYKMKIQGFYILLFASEQEFKLLPIDFDPFTDDVNKVHVTIFTIIPFSCDW